IGEKGDAIRKKLMHIEPPYFIKPNASGSSIGCGIVNGEEELADALNNAFKYDDEVLVEKYIKGREIQFAAAFGKPLGCVEVKPNDLFYSYDAKYTKGKTEYLVNPELTKEEYAECESAAVRANEIIGCRGVSRTDIILSREGGAYILELNTLPGLTELSLVPMIAGNKGISFNELVEDIIEDAVLKKEKQ
ncbi:MAG: D-alanine--D-alanine ligase, partial [Deltaproteobacteria bacterium]|nr:D-alanine--D-alanine ligase [Deltaproteobacteria bacterium]